MSNVRDFPRRGKRWRVYLFRSCDPEEEVLFEWGAYTNPDRAHRALDMLTEYGLLAMLFDGDPEPPPRDDGPDGGELLRKVA